MRFLSVGLLVLAATQAVLSAPVFRREDSNDVHLYLHNRANNAVGGNLKVFTRGEPGHPSNTLRARHGSNLPNIEDDVPPSPPPSPTNTFPQTARARQSPEGPPQHKTAHVNSKPPNEGERDKATDASVPKPKRLPPKSSEPAQEGLDDHQRPVASTSRAQEHTDPKGFRRAPPRS